MPRLSIITINRNNAAGLEATLDSVWNRQPSFTDFEHIVIDGASTDGSTTVTDRYADRLAYYVSEPDSGIYNAMNKGILHASGDYLLFLNSGDRLSDDSLIAIFSCEADEDILYADLDLASDDGNLTITYPDRLTLPFMLESAIGHPASFIRRRMFERGMYDETLKICSDWTFFMDRIIMEGATTRHIPVVASIFDQTGISADPKSAALIKAERNAYIHRHFPESVLELAREYTLREQALDIMSKHRTDALLSSRWVQRKARQCIKALMRIDRLIHNRHQH